MKRIFVIICAALLSSTALSNNGVQHFEGEDTATDEVPCLGILVNISSSYRGVAHSFYDNNGGWHTMVNIIASAQYDAIGSDMSWSVKRGVFTIFIQNSNSNGQFMQVNEGHEVAIANGDYPNLKFSAGLSGTINANGEVVSFRFTPESTSCVGP